MSEWEISKTLGRCWGTDAKFEVGAEYYAALVETENGFERRDFSVEYWQENQPPVYCYWRTKMVRPDHKKKLFVDDDMLMTFFERLADDTGPDKVNFRFVLTLVLMRKRILKYDSSRYENGNEIWTLRVAGAKRNVHVVNPHLTEDQVAELSSQIGGILQIEM
ncbi:MAG TPA: hypothetical protein HPP87_00295 [Planctomycetes bacterium]|nr:hypothetical protein [Planctomycetota bacterium]